MAASSRRPSGFQGRTAPALRPGRRSLVAYHPGGVAMAVDDVWYLKARGSDGARLPSRAHGRGKRWRVRWVDDQGQTRSRFFERRTDAERFDANVRADLSRGQ